MEYLALQFIVPIYISMKNGLAIPATFLISVAPGLILTRSMTTSYLARLLVCQPLIKAERNLRLWPNMLKNVISQAARWLDVGGEIIVFDTTIQTVPTQWHIQQHELWETVANAIGGTITGNEKEWCVVNISI